MTQSDGRAGVNRPRSGERGQAPRPRLTRPRAHSWQFIVTGSGAVAGTQVGCPAAVLKRGGARAASNRSPMPAPAPPSQEAERNVCCRCRVTPSGVVLPAASAIIGCPAAPGEACSRDWPQWVMPARDAKAPVDRSGASSAVGQIAIYAGHAGDCKPPAKCTALGFQVADCSLTRAAGKAPYAPRYSRASASGAGTAARILPIARSASPGRRRQA